MSDGVVHRSRGPRPRVVAAASLALALALTLGASTAHADDATVARTRFEEGRRAFRAGRYAEAAEAYEHAAAARPHPAPLVNAAEAWELDGNIVRAAQACDRALASTDDAKVRASVEQRLGRYARVIGTLSVRAVRGAAELGVRVDGGEVLSPPARVRVSAGRHRLTYVEAGRAREPDDEILVAAGEERVVLLAEGSAPRPGAPPAPPAPPAPSTAAPPPVAPVVERAPRPSTAAGPPVVSWVAFGVGAAGGVATGIFGALTVDAKQAYEAEPTRGTLDTFHERRLATNIALGTAVLSVVVGVVVWVVRPASSAATAAQSTTPGLVPFRF